MLNSLKQDQTDELREHLDKIKSHNEHNRKQDREQDRLVQVKQQEVWQKITVLQMRWNAEQAAKLSKLEREQERQKIYDDGIPRATLEDIGKFAGQFLQGVQRAWLMEEDKPNPSIPISGLTIRQLTENVEPRARIMRRNKPKGATVKREDLQLWSRDMENFTTNVLEFLETIDLDIAVAEQEILETIQDWIQSSNSRAVWVRGKPQECYPSSMTTIAARVVSVLVEWGVPVLCYFSNPGGDDKDACLRTKTNLGNTSEENILIDLIYSLFRQMVNQLLPETRMPRKLSRDQFEGFDGSVETFESALKLFKQLFQHAPANIYIIVDGIERLDDDPACESLLEELLIFLQDMRTDTGSERVVKLLYTTASQCEALETLDDDFLEFVKPRARKAKHRRRGMKRLRDFDPESGWDSSDSILDVSDSE